LSIGLVLGVLGEAVLGAFVVYTKLNAYVVMFHFMVGIGLLTVAILLTLRSGHGRGRGTVVVGSGALWLTRVLLGLFVVVLIAGTATTGAGPHAGGKGSKRVPIGLEDMTRIHAELVIGTTLVLLALLWLLWRTDAPSRVQDNGRILLGAVVAQGIIGYTQFFTHLPAVLVWFHVLGATLVWSTALWFHHGLSDHRPEPVTAEEPESESPQTDGAGPEENRRRSGPGRGAVVPV
jgi:cytochrome c oxidase assembly protein subunit 15